MSEWRNGSMQTYLRSPDRYGVCFFEQPCRVRMIGDAIDILYRDPSHYGGNEHLYTGLHQGGRRYHLNGSNEEGEATLAQGENASVLEGSWRGPGGQGMWRIELIEA